MENSDTNTSAVTTHSGNTPRREDTQDPFNINREQPLTQTQHPTDEPIDTQLQSMLEETQYSQEEKADVNNISVTLGKNIPTIILYGPPASGKTMALLRMIRYLSNQNYRIEPDRNFRPGHDEHYKRMCDGLSTLSRSSYAPGGTDTVGFMLAQVIKEQPICQFLEAPGEHFFNEKVGKGSTDYPTYINEIISSEQNPRIWCFFVERDWGKDQEMREAYAAKIRALYNTAICHRGRPADKVIFLFNKADKYTQYYKDGYPILRSFYNEIQRYYPGIFNEYIRTGIAALLFGKYNFRAVAFSAGTFNGTNDNRTKWQPSENWYCEQFWKAILSCL